MSENEENVSECPSSEQKQQRINISLCEGWEPAQEDAHEQQQQIQLDERGDSVQQSSEKGVSDKVQ